MTIQTFSPLQTSGQYYLNSDSFESKLMFTDTNTSLNYIVCRYESTEWKIIANGKLQGYNDGTVNLQYKFDFDNFIKVNQEKNPVLTLSSGTTYTFNSNNTSKVSICLATTDLLADNSTKITYKSNGEIVLNVGQDPSTLTSTTNINYQFMDKVDGSGYIGSTSPFIYNSTYFPFSLYLGTSIILNTKDVSNNVVSTFTRTSTVNCENYLVYIPANAYKIEIQINSLPVVTTYTNINTNCASQVFYYGINGNFDMIYYDGNNHEVNNITKEFITVGNKQLPIRINYNKQLKINTGFKLNQSQVYSLIKTPYVFTLSTLLLKRYMLDTNTFEGYIGSRFSERNIELILTDEKEYKRKTNIDLTFWD